MARAKRLNAEKVTISIDSDILLNAKHKALDLRMTLSDYMQSLVKQDVGVTEAPAKQEEKKVGAKDKGKSNLKPVVRKPIVISEPVLGTDLFSDESIDTQLKECIAEILELHQSGTNKVEIAKQINAKGYKTQTDKEWNRQSVKWAIDKYSSN
jgi:hypothetical protein